MWKRFKTALRWLILITFAVWTVFPFMWMFLTSFKSRKDIYKFIFIPLFQFEPTLENWQNILLSENFHRAFTNGLIVATSSSLVVLILGALAGYSLSRFKFQKWKNKDIALWILSQRMLPPVAVLVPFFLFMRAIHMLDTVLAIILAHSAFNLPLSTWLMMDFFDDIPIEIEESSLVDGCSHLGTLLRITLPLSIHGLVAVFVISFIFSWNELMFMIALSYDRAYTLPVLIASTLAFQQMEWWNLAVYVTLAVAPSLILTMVFEKYLVRGLTLGAVKF